MRDVRLLDLATGSVLRMWQNPLDALRWLAAFELAPGSRWIGYFSFGLGQLFETIGTKASDDLHLPLFVLALVESGNTSVPGLESEVPAGRMLGSSFSQNEYERAVEICKQYIAAGDVFQINLSQRFIVKTHQTPSQIFQRLTAGSPAAYGALLDLGDFALVSNSPELFFRVENQAKGERQIITRPIKGTRPNQPGMEQELRDSIKDQAELNMIVDLERNDLGRICRIGSVRVVQPRTIETHPTVYHGVATIAGHLRPEVGLVEILAAMFPGGSVTGAPKIRAMQIIDQIEPVARGPYCGAIGYIDADGSMQFNIAIRTIILKDNHAYISVGGAVVADSCPAEEYGETLVKARAMFAAIGV